MGLFLVLPEEYHGIHRGLSFATKYRSSKMRVFLFVMKTVFPMFVRISTQFAGYRCLIRAVRGTGNFVWQQATLVQGCTSEAQLNMDVNLCRLPDKRQRIPKSPVPLAGIMWHLYPADSVDIQPKQPERQFIIKKNTHYKNCWHFIPDKDKSPAIP